MQLKIELRERMSKEFLPEPLSYVSDPQEDEKRREASKILIQLIERKKTQ